MDFTSIFGMVGGVAVILFAFLTSNGNFFDLASIIITIFGSFFATLLAVRIGPIKNIWKLIKIAFRSEKNDSAQLIVNIVEFADKARKEGILALDEAVDQIEEPFFRNGLKMAVDGIDGEILKKQLYNEIEQIQERHSENSKLFAIWAEYAPAFGMIGTLVGLIEMMNNMGGDASVIGAGMAKALVTTLYGSIMANMFLAPIKRKLDAKDIDEMLYKELVVEGVSGIQSGDMPRQLEAKLLAFLQTKNRISQFAEDNL